MTRPANWSEYLYAAHPIDAHDADTVRLRVDLGFSITFDLPCRLLGIQAPEVSGPGVTPAERAAGLAARDRLRTLLQLGTPSIALGRPVLIQTLKDRTEGRGRYLARIWLEDDEVADILVREGHACRYDGEGKAPKWQSAGVWRSAAGVLHRADGTPL